MRLRDDLPEELQAAAARELRRLRDLKEEYEAGIRPAVVAARAAGISVRRTAELAGLAASTVQEWAAEARDGA